MSDIERTIELSDKLYQDTLKEGNIESMLELAKKYEVSHVQDRFNRAFKLYKKAYELKHDETTLKELKRISDDFYRDFYVNLQRFVTMSCRSTSYISLKIFNDMLEKVKKLTTANTREEFIQIAKDFIEEHDTLKEPNKLNFLLWTSYKGDLSSFGYSYVGNLPEFSMLFNYMGYFIPYSEYIFSEVAEGKYFTELKKKYPNLPVGHQEYEIIFSELYAEYIASKIIYSQEQGKNANIKLVCGDSSGAELDHTLLQNELPIILLEVAKYNRKANPELKLNIDVHNGDEKVEFKNRLKINMGNGSSITIDLEQLLTGIENELRKNPCLDKNDVYKYMQYFCKEQQKSRSPYVSPEVTRTLPEASTISPTSRELPIELGHQGFMVELKSTSLKPDTSSINGKFIDGKYYFARIIKGNILDIAVSKNSLGKRVEGATMSLEELAKILSQLGINKEQIALVHGGNRGQDDRFHYDKNCTEQVKQTLDRLAANTKRESKSYITM